MTKVKICITCRCCSKSTIVVSQIDGVSDEHIDMLSKNLKQYICNLQCHHCNRKIKDGRCEAER